uniref:Phosphatidylinositol-3-phosphatase SAC1 n=1 Tax=Mesocestoides corti TaxID=53468 RepID=A0A5K3F4E9_MESCO
MDSPRSYELFIGPDQYVLYDSSSTKKGRPLVIDRVTNTVSVSSFDLEHYESVMPRPAIIYGILGTVRLLSGRFLMTIDKCELVGNLFGHQIFKVTASSLRPFAKSTAHLNKMELEAETAYINMLTFVLQVDGFYFSNTYDLTVSQQRISEFGPETRNTSLFERAEKQFLWNYSHLNDWSSILTDVAKTSGLSLNISNYLTPVMFGFVGILKASSSLGSEGTVASYAIISRRSVKRAGTRFYARGLDSEANSANFVETEQILYLPPSHISSFVQVRGSVPLFWSQRPTLKYKPLVKMGRLAAAAQSTIDNPPESPLDVEPEQRAIIQRHIHEACYLHRYGKIFAVNLLDQTGMERQLCKTYTLAAQSVDPQELKYESFDFHRECKALKWHRLSILLDRLEGDIVAMGQFRLLSPIGKETLRDAVVVSRQTGVFRTNCIDCLDRTNVVQSLIGRRAVDLAIRDAGLVNSADRVVCGNYMRAVWPGFETAFKEVWADNADACSIQYSGTAALKTDFTRTGKRTFKGMLLDGYYSLTRYYLNNFVDGFRQDAFNLFLGHYDIFRPDNGQPKLPLPRGREPSDVESLRIRFMPLFLAFATSMSVLCLIFPADLWTERVAYFLFWGVASVTSAITIYAYGEDYVNKPIFPME